MDIIITFSIVVIIVSIFAALILPTLITFFFGAIEAFVFFAVGGFKIICWLVKATIVFFFWSVKVTIYFCCWPFLLIWNFLKKCSSQQP